MKKSITKPMQVQRGELKIANILIEALKSSLSVEQQKFVYFLIDRFRRKYLVKRNLEGLQLGRIRVFFTPAEYIEYRQSWSGGNLDKDHLRRSLYTLLERLKDTGRYPAVTVKVKEYLEWIERQNFDEREKELIEPICNDMRGISNTLYTFNLVIGVGREINRDDEKRLWFVDFHPYTLPFFLNYVKDYTILKALYFFSLKSIHALRLYEVLEKRKKLRTYKLSYEELVKRLGFGEPPKREGDEWRIPKTYLRNKTLVIKKFLKPAVDEINKKSDLSVSYELIKTGRKIEGVNFNISPKFGYVADILEKVSDYIFLLSKEGIETKIGISLSFGKMEIFELTNPYQLAKFLVSAFNRLSPSSVLLFLYALSKVGKRNLDIGALLEKFVERFEKNEKVNNPTGLFRKQLLENLKDYVEPDIWKYLLSDFSDIELETYIAEEAISTGGAISTSGKGKAEIRESEPDELDKLLENFF